jgi:hypothetical protein
MTDTNANVDLDLVRVTEPSDAIVFSVADAECFAQALLSPPQQSTALTRAFVRRDLFLQTECAHHAVADINQRHFERAVDGG